MAQNNPQSDHSSGDDENNAGSRGNIEMTTNPMSTPAKSRWGKLRKSVRTEQKSDDGEGGLEENVVSAATAFETGASKSQHQRGAVAEKLAKMRQEADEAARKQALLDAKADPDVETAMDRCCSKIPLLHPEGVFRPKWDVVILLLVVYSAIDIPLKMAMLTEADNPAWTITVDLLFITDLVLNFRTAYFKDNGELETRQHHITSNYMKLWGPIDICACTPLDWFIPSDPSAEGGTEARYKVLLRLLKVPRLLRVGRIFKYLERFKYAGAWKLIKLVIVVLMVCHWIGCIFFFICLVEGPSEDPRVSIVWTDENVDGDLPNGSKYALALYTAVYMMIGEGVDPMTPLEQMYSALVVLGGMVITSVVIGNVSKVIANQSVMESAYENKLGEVREALITLDVPQSVQDRAQNYFEFMWLRHRRFDRGRTFIDDMSTSLQTDIMLAMMKDIVVKCDIFSSLPDAVVVAVVRQLKMEIYLPGDKMCREGDIGEEMYFLVSGECQVTTIKTGDKILATLETGAVFGEVAILQHQRRNATITASSNSDVRLLKKKDFRKVAIKYPELQEVLRKRTIKKGSNSKTKKVDMDQMKLTELSEGEMIGEILSRIMKLEKAIQNGLPVAASRSIPTPKSERRPSKALTQEAKPPQTTETTTTPKLDWSKAKASAKKKFKKSKSRSTMKSPVERMKAMRNREKVLSIQTSFQGQVVIVGNANRKFVRQGQMALRASDGTQVYSSVQMFLFSDLLLIGVLRSDSSLPTYNLVAQIHLDEVEELRYDNAQQAVVINEHILRDLKGDYRSTQGWLSDVVALREAGME